jgi:hypothetical protein
VSQAKTKGNIIFLARNPSDSSLGYPKLGQPTRRRAFPSYKETIARLLTFEHYRNLIESQSPGAGVTCYSYHLPGIKNTSLSNKGKLSTWKIHEVSDLTSIVETIYKAGPTMAIVYPLSRLARQEDRVEHLDLPVLLEMLLRELPPSIKMAERIRVKLKRIRMWSRASSNDGAHLRTPSATP